MRCVSPRYRTYRAVCQQQQCALSVCFGALSQLRLLRSPHGFRTLTQRPNAVSWSVYELFSLLCSCVLERCAVCLPLSVCRLNFLTADESTARHFFFQFDLGLSLTMFVNRLREWLLLLGRPTIVGRSSVLSVGHFPRTFHPGKITPLNLHHVGHFPSSPQNQEIIRILEHGNT